MTPASVGFHCPECARGGRQQVYTARTLGRLGRPVVTQILVAINVAVFLLGSLGNGGGLLASVEGRFDLDYGLFGPAVADGEWYRLVTGGFLHAGLLHLGMNMLALWILGGQIEPVLGKARFVGVYVASLLAASLGVMVLSPNDLTVGASGAIFGLLGLALANQLARRVNIWESGLGGILLINLLFTFGVRGISIGGHIGGLVGGYVCGLVVFHLGPRVRNDVVISSLLVALAGAFGAAAYLLAQAT